MDTIENTSTELTPETWVKNRMSVSLTASQFDRFTAFVKDLPDTVTNLTRFLMYVIENKDTQTDKHDTNSEVLKKLEADNRKQLQQLNEANLIINEMTEQLKVLHIKNTDLHNQVNNTTKAANAIQQETTTQHNTPEKKPFFKLWFEN